jgi:hypothetical protein
MLAPQLPLQHSGFVVHGEPAGKHETPANAREFRVESARMTGVA